MDMARVLAFANWTYFRLYVLFLGTVLLDVQVQREMPSQIDISVFVYNNGDSRL